MVNQFRRRIPRDNSRQMVLIVIRYIILILPIICGLFNQLRMLITGGTTGIYVFVTPPGTLMPEVSLEFTWWITLVVATGFSMVISYMNKQRTVRRTVYPLYLYFIFLLLLVKPV